MVAKPLSTSSNIVKMILAISTVVFLLISVNRAMLLLNASQVPAVIADCDAKWVQVSETGSTTRTKQQVQYYPVAETHDGQKIKGDIMTPSKSMCNQMVGNQVTVLLHHSDPANHKIYSFIQFWALPLLGMALCLFIILSFVNRILVQATAFIFTLGFIATGSHELGYWGNANSLVPYDSKNQDFSTDKTTSPDKQKSKMKLERCVWASMRKEKIDNRWELKRLLCQDENITDLSSINDLTHLEELYLQNNNLTTLESMGEWRYLRVISVAGNKSFVSTKGIEKAINLEEFQANKTELSDLSGMETLSKLKIIGAMQNKISDISALAGLENLQDLTLSYNQIQDISALANKPALEQLTIYSNPINDISALFNNNKIKLFGFNSKSFSRCDQIEQLKANIVPKAKLYFPDHCR